MGVELSWPGEARDVQFEHRARVRRGWRPRGRHEMRDYVVFAMFAVGVSVKIKCVYGYSTTDYLIRRARLAMVDGRDADFVQQ